MTQTPIDIEALEALALDVAQRLGTSANMYDRRQAEKFRNAVPELIKAPKERDALASALEQANHVIAINGLNEKECLTEIARLETALTSLRALLAEAGEALEPFAKSADDYPPAENENNRITWSHNFTLKFIRRAAATLASIQSALRDASPTTEKPE